MKVAVTYKDGMVGQSFADAEAFKIYEIKDGEIAFEMVVQTMEQGAKAIADFLSIGQVTNVICGDIDETATFTLAMKGIMVYAGVEGPADGAVMAFLEEKLASTDEATCGHVTGSVSCTHNCSTCGGCH